MRKTHTTTPSELLKKLHFELHQVYNDRYVIYLTPKYETFLTTMNSITNPLELDRTFAKTSEPTSAFIKIYKKTLREEVSTKHTPKKDEKDSQPKITLEKDPTEEIIKALPQQQKKELHQNVTRSMERLLERALCKKYALELITMMQRHLENDILYAAMSGRQLIGEKTFSCDRQRGDLSQVRGISRQHLLILTVGYKYKNTEGKTITVPVTIIIDLSGLSKLTYTTLNNEKKAVRSGRENILVLPALNIRLQTLALNNGLSQTFEVVSLNAFSEYSLETPNSLIIKSYEELSETMKKIFGYTRNSMRSVTEISEKHKKQIENVHNRITDNFEQKIKAAINEARTFQESLAEIRKQDIKTVTTRSKAPQPDKKQHPSVAQLTAQFRNELTVAASDTDKKEKGTSINREGFVEIGKCSSETEENKSNSEGFLIVKAPGTS